MLKSKGKIRILFVWSAWFIVYACPTHAGSHIPQWVLTPPADNTQALYGVGERRTLDQATTAALVEIAGKLGTAIKADTSIRAATVNDQIQESFEENIKANVANTEFSDYEVVKTEQNENSYWVLVKVDKGKMANNLKSKLDQSTSELKHEFQTFQKVTSLQKAESRPELQSKLDTMKANAMTLRAIDNTFDVKPVFSDIHNKENILREARDAILVRIKYDKNTEIFAGKLETMLTEQKVKIAKGAASVGETLISITGGVDYRTLMKVHYAKMNVDIRAIDDTGKILATSIHQITGASPTNDESALEQANYLLAKKLKEEGLLHSVGL